MTADDSGILSAEEEAEMISTMKKISERPKRPRKYIAEEIKGRGGPTTKLFKPAQIIAMQTDIVQHVIAFETGGTREKEALEQRIYFWAKSGYPTQRISEAWGKDKKQIYRVIDKIEKRGRETNVSNVINDVLR